MSDKTRHAEELMLLGNKIAYYRRKKKLSQEQLAERIGISRVHISHIEAPNVIQAFSINVLFDIADALGVTAMELFNFDK
jgi:transcriptional regulator with XRE-family HTH domain